MCLLQINAKNLTKVTIPKAFSELFEPHRYKGYYGGRGGGKSFAAASALVVKGAEKPMRMLCCREIQRSIKDSSKRLIDDRIRAFGLEKFYHSTETEIRGVNGSLFLFSGLKTNPEAIKSMEGVDIAWVEEADKISQRSLELLIPTIRKDNSEIWFTWNPVSELDPVDRMLRGQTPPPDSIVRQVNFDQNPFFPDVLKEEAEFMRKQDPVKYAHIWQGGYNDVKEGAYYAKQISDAISQNRITHVPHNPEMPVFAVFDLGMADLTTIWFFQLAGGEVHLIDYYESQYTSATEDAVFLNQKGYNYKTLWLPHDGKAKQKGTGKSTQEIFQGLGFNVQIVPNISVMAGIDAARTLFPRCYFDSIKCEAGLRALKAYHEDYNEDLRIGKGPKHDWSSHASDAFRYLAVVFSLETNTSEQSVRAMETHLQGGHTLTQKLMTVNQEIVIPDNYFDRNSGITP